MIVRLTPAQMDELQRALANAKYGTIRIDTGENAKGPFFKYDNGGGWTPPLYGEIR